MPNPPRRTRLSSLSLSCATSALVALVTFACTAQSISDPGDSGNGLPPGEDSSTGVPPGPDAGKPTGGDGGPSGGGDSGQPEKTPSLGDPCTSPGSLRMGGGGLFICDSGKWRYALRSDVPDGIYGAFTSRPEWYPRLREVFNIPAATCKVQLSQAPIDPADVTSIVPYGLMVGDHVTPIDHQYIGVTPLLLEPAARTKYVEVRAPADGTIIEASSLGSPTSMRVVISHGCETVTVYMVLNQLAGVLAPYQTAISGGQFARPDLAVKAGDLIALQRDNPMDFSVHDGAAWLSGFAHPFPYTSAETWKPYTVDPLLYLPASVASQYEAKMQRTAAPRSGKIDLDKEGSAAGNWFLEGTIGYAGNFNSVYQSATSSVVGGKVAGKNTYSWSHLSLSPHWQQPSVWMASLGTWNDPAGDFKQFAIRPGPKAPDAITPADGVVVYELTRFSWAAPDGGVITNGNNPPIGYTVTVSSQVEGVLAVRVNNNHTVTVEKRPDLNQSSAFTGFTQKAETYWR